MTKIVYIEFTSGLEILDNLSAISFLQLFSLERHH